MYRKMNAKILTRSETSEDRSDTKPRRGQQRDSDYQKSPILIECSNCNAIAQVFQNTREDTDNQQ